MIWFSAFLVVVAVGLLVVGVVTSKLLLVYVAIGVSGVALLALGVGAVIRRRELFGKPKTAAPELARPEPVGVHLIAAHPEPQVLPPPATVPAGPGRPAAAQPGPSLAGYLPTEQPPRTQPPAWGSGIAQTARAAAPAAAIAVEQAQAGSPDEWTADAQRRPASFTPRTTDRQQAGDDQRPTGDQRPAGDQQAPGDQQAITDQPPAEDQKPPEDQVAKDREQPAAQPPAEERAPPADTAPADADTAPADTALADGPPAHTPPADTPPADREGGPALAAVPAAPQAPPAPPAAARTAEPAPDLQREVTVVPGVPRYHNARCILIRFMGDDDLEKMTLGAARKAGCTPCRACLPDQPEKNPELPPGSRVGVPVAA